MSCGGERVSLGQCRGSAESRSGDSKAFFAACCVFFFCGWVGEALECIALACFLLGASGDALRAGPGAEPKIPPALSRLEFDEVKAVVLSFSLSLCNFAEARSVVR